MASLSMASVILRFSPLRSSSPKIPTHGGSVQFARLSSSSLASTHSISGLRAVLPQKISTVVSQNPQRLRSLTVFAHKGYKMKTHKVLPFFLFPLLFFSLRFWELLSSKVWILIAISLLGLGDWRLETIFGLCCWQASAKRFRVTGRGKIVRRRSGKQHLLAKKNNKRKLRLSKMVCFLVYVHGHVVKGI